jgi:hypothetical protein
METCPHCGNEIDPTVCGCGTSKEAHGSTWNEGHPKPKKKPK